jgi:hypothetical protein
MHKGIMAELRYSALEVLTSHNFKTGKDTTVGDGALDNATLDGISTYSDGTALYVAWRSKLRGKSAKGLGNQNDKMVYVAQSRDGEVFSGPARLSNSNGAFLPVLTGNGMGDVYAVWQDERSGAAYDLYFNVSHDHGATWKKNDIRLDVGKEAESFSGEPNILAKNDSLWLTWVESGKNGCGVYVRSSADKGEVWRDAVEVAPCTSHQSLFPQLVQSGNKLFVYWYDQKKVRGGMSLDAGSTWSILPPIAEVEADGVSMQEMTVKADSDGVVHLFFGKKGASKGDRANLYYSRSEDGAQFSPPKRLNSGSEYQGSAILPMVAFDSSNKVLVAWQDYRYYRPVIIGIHSIDQGKTWTTDFLMDEGPANGASQFPHLISNDKQWWASYVHYSPVNVAKMEKGSAVVKEIDPVRMSSVPLRDQYVADFSNLERRVSTWWETRLKADWAASYELMDPFMRSTTKKATYIASQGLVNYFEYKIVGFEKTTDQQAKVTVKFTSEVPEMEINGKTYSVPKKETEIVQDWIWVDGSWYMLFKDLMGNNFREL